MTKNEKIIKIIRVKKYYYWDLNFPFRHLKKEHILIFTENAIYKIMC